MRRILAAETAGKAGERVRVAGWVAVRRDHGKLIFIDLRDASGVLQVVFRPDDVALHAEAEKLRPEWVVAVEGTVKERPKGMENEEIPTGTVELPAEKLEILNEAKTPPFPIDTDGLDIEEELRLKYRYLDLRRERLKKNLRLRSRFVEACRKYLFQHGFAEIETPLLTKSTPEGSRDFLVPSRLHPGKFYALPQSPQQYKQLLMVAGFERYFQIARAVRDEDLRADRGFEHTQIDLEMSFVEQADVMNMVEGLMISACEAVGAKIKEKPFPVFSYAEAVQKFGADKFDLRSDEEKKGGALALAWVRDFPVFSAEGGSAFGGEKAKWTYGHNPFTAPRPEDEAKLLAEEDIGKLISLQYDLVCNGFEVGGGGIRIRKRELLEKVFEIIGHSRADIEARFGHMLEALEMGPPPHRGIALGVDRLTQGHLGEKHILVEIIVTTNSGGETPGGIGSRGR